MNHLTEALVTIALAIVGLAIVSVLVSRNAQTSSVIQATASGFSNSLATAEAPVTGASVNPILSYPTGSGGIGNLVGGQANSGYLGFPSYGV